MENMTPEEMKQMDEISFAMEALLKKVDVTDFEQYRDAMTEIAIHFVNALDQERIRFTGDGDDLGMMQVFIGLALASNASKHQATHTIH